MVDKVMRAHKPEPKLRRSNAPSAQERTWPFANIEWWIQKIYFESGIDYLDTEWQKLKEAVRQSGAADTSADPSNQYEELFTTLSDGYDYAMRTLSLGSQLYDPRVDDYWKVPLSKTQAMCRLFALRALRKWKLALPESWHIAESMNEKNRRTKAIQGFVERNQSLANVDTHRRLRRGLAEEMRQVLTEWLPEPVTSDFTSQTVDHWVRRFRDGSKHYVLTPLWVSGRFGPGGVAEHLSRRERIQRLQEWKLLAPTFPEIPVGHTDMDHCRCRLCAVPKQWNKDRLITVEPVYGTFAQQHVRRLIGESIHRGPLAGTCMDLLYTDGQAIQRRLALKASLHGRRMATIDLKDASDSISTRDLIRVFPSWVHRYVDVTRSTEYATELGGDTFALQYTAKLNIFAGMGNATTFVLETLFFASYAEAIRRYYRLRGPKIVSVFGDDVICSNEVAQLAQEEGYIGFQVGAAKSFMQPDDYLRESCGIFAYNGDDVTVPKVDGYTNNWEGHEGLCDLHLRLRSSNFGPFIMLAHHIAKACRGFIPNWPFLVEGFPSISDPTVPYDVLPKTRWNPELQRREAQVRCREAELSYEPCYRHDRESSAEARFRVSALLDADLIQQIRTEERRTGLHAVPWETGKYVWKNRWHATVLEPARALISQSDDWD